MSLFEIESIIVQELENCPGRSKPYSELLKNIARTLKVSPSVAGDHLFTLVKRLVYRGKLSVTQKSLPVDLNYHTGADFVMTLKPAKA